MGKSFVFGVVMLSVLLLTGCFETKAPMCSDNDVAELVEEIYAEHVEELDNDNPMSAMYIDVLPKKIIKLDSARAVRYDKEVKLRECKAVAYFDNNQTQDIEYTVQLNEQDDTQFYVELDLSFVEDLVKAGLLQNVFK